MLTVLAIIGIMLGIGIPAITNMMKSGGLSAATRQVSNALSQARQYAITQRVKTCVVFPYNGTTGTSSTNLAPWYQSYAVVAIGSTTNYLSRWEHLPVGTVFMDYNTVLGTPPCLDNNLGSAYLPFPTNCNSVLVPGNAGTLSYIAFTPTGAASNTCAFTITEGLVNNSGTVTPTSKTSTSLVNSVVVTVDNIIGRIRVIRP